jgi:hypothetical protein
LRFGATAASRSGNRETRVRADGFRRREVVDSVLGQRLMPRPPPERRLDFFVLFFFVAFFFVDFLAMGFLSVNLGTVDKCID